LHDDERSEVAGIVSAKLNAEKMFAATGDLTENVKIKGW